MGKFNAKFTVNSFSVENDVYIATDLDRPLLSRFDSQNLNLINKIETTSKIESKIEGYKEESTAKCQKLFTGLGKIAGDDSITLRNHSTPFALSVPRNFPLPLLSKTKSEIQKTLDMSVIKKMKYPQNGVLPW